MPPTSSDELLAAKFAVLLPQLDERQRRLLLGAEGNVSQPTPGDQEGF